MQGRKEKRKRKEKKYALEFPVKARRQPDRDSEDFVALLGNIAFPAIIEGFAHGQAIDQAFDKSVPGAEGLQASV